MTRQLMLAFMLSLTLMTAKAQTYTGKVVDTTQKPVAAVSVTLLNETGKVVAFARTGNDGAFSVILPEGKNAVNLLSEFRNGQTVVMTEEGFDLKEVKVTAGRIMQRSDTLVFSVDGFRQQQDRSIADVIRKMPGLDVKEDGEITYQGKAINEFTVEGMDLTNGKYAQISENLSADKVKSVEVRENNQPKHVLRDVQFSEQAALNLVLRDDAKNVWQGIADISTGLTLKDGARWLRDTRAMGMMFGKKCQSVSMWKTNNTGRNIKTEVSDLIFESNTLSPLSSRLSGIGGSSADIDDERYTFNDSQLAATNWLFRTRGDNDLRIQASYFFDKTRSVSYSETLYNDIAGGWSMTEDASVNCYTSKWEGELQYKVNKDNIYLNNRLKANINFDRSMGQSSLNGTATHEQVSPRSRFVSDAVEVIRKMKGGNSYTISSAIAYDCLPGRMLLCDSTTEMLDMSALRWNTQANFRHGIWKWSVAWNVGLDLTINWMDIENPLAKREGVRYDEQRLYAYPSLSYENKRLRVNASPRVSWLRREYEGVKGNDMLFEPMVFLNYKHSSSLEYGALYLLKCMAGGMGEVCDIPVFTSYRTMTRGNGQLDESRTHSVSVYARYHQIMKGLFGNVSVSYNSMRHVRMYASEALGNFHCSYATGLFDNTGGWTLSGDVSKSFSWAKTIVRAGCGWNTYRYHILLGGTRVPFQTRGLSASVGFSMKPLPLISIEEKSLFSRSTQQNRLEADAPDNALNHFEHEVKLFILPGKWQMEVDNEFYHSNDHSVSFSHFADVSVSYRTKQYEIGIWLNNIMGADKYERRYTTSTQHVYSVTRLRTRELMARVFFNL